MFLKKVVLLLILAFLGYNNLSASSFDERRQYLLDYYSKARPHDKFWGDNDVKTAMGFVLARLETGRDVAYAMDMLDRMQDDPGFDMFDYHQNIDAYLRYGSKYSKALKDKVRKKMTSVSYTEDGSTENHRLMFKTSGYLTATAFPDWAGADSVKAHCEAVLLDIIDKTVRYGIKEFDSPTYGTFYITCLLSLYDHTKDAAFKNRVQMALEWHLLNMAPEWMNGYLVSSSLREYYFACSPQAESPYPLLGWLMFGGDGPTPDLKQVYRDGEILVNNEGFYTLLAAVSSYRVPKIIERIATDRSKPFVHKESHDMTPMAQLNFPWGFKKYTYIDKHYGLTSHWDGISLGWSAQMRRWKLVWESEARASSFFLTHLSHHGRALDNFFGATSREQVLQHNGTLLAMYKIESEEPNPYVIGVVPMEAIKTMKEDPSGWIFFDGGTVLFGVKFCHPYVWEGEKEFRGIPHRLLRCNQSSTAAVVETASPEKYQPKQGKTALDLFADDVLKKTKLEYVIENPEYRYAVYNSLDGDTLKLVFNYGRYVNGQKIDYENWPLCADPWMEQDVDGRFLTVVYGDMSRIYDFRNWRIIDNNGNTKSMFTFNTNK